ncbi:MAG: FeoB-associated Cys-rich membrane protein [Clostridia bacterium]|nr:FeoB-associated Cys-rich membrane protein [Clostridia bacterium]
MKPADWIILAAILCAVGFAVFFAVRKKRRGGCCGDCSACGGACSCEKMTEPGKKSADK